ncbi:hypothetical protein A3860_30185 [Niastella vici]|uniref:Uncharacterized protein n=1 Tax=Niastella vici TaxID=1703345 RepID=A0A1V9FUD3_9BACT|nr:hypothetical protein [Niastella vici]OQP61963.1 hypothetical protein A3860_30185 [Niastella vici]
MTIRKVLVYSLIIPSVLSLLFNIPSIVKKDLGPLWLIPGILVAWTIGVFIGVIICAVVQEKRAEPWFYIGGQVITYGAVAAFILYQFYLTEKHELRFGNIEHNHSMVGLDRDSIYDSFDVSYIKTAFLKLESKFKDPNSFHLTSFFTIRRDTVSSNYNETVYTVYFAYTTTPEKKQLFSKISVLENQPTIDIFNGDALHHGEYKYLKAKEKQHQIEQMNEIKEALKDLPDTIKQQMRESLEEK